MVKILQGAVPKKITYVCKEPIEVTMGWDDLEDQMLQAPITATPAFPVDPESKTAMATAERWVVGWRRNGREIVRLARDNLPISHVQIIGLDVRSEGGRAYKVMLPMGPPVDSDHRRLYVDMREDVFLDTMLVNGVAKGGTIKGPFVWGRLNSQMRLVRVGSALHKALLACQDRMAERVLGRKDWQPGHVYMTRDLKPTLFLGFVDTEEAEEVGNPHIYSKPGFWPYRRKEHRNVPLWCDLEFFGYDHRAPAVANGFQQRWNRGLDDHEGSQLFRFKLIKKPTLIRDTGEVLLGDRWMENIRAHAMRYVEHSTDNRRVAWSNGQRDPSRERLSLGYAAAMAHIRKPGEPAPEYVEFEQFWKETKANERR